MRHCGVNGVVLLVVVGVFLPLVTSIVVIMMIPFARP